MLSSGSQKNQVSFSMVRKTWNHVSYNWFFGLPNPWIVRSQIETKRILILTCILTNPRKYCLWSDNLERLIFVKKNWSNDPRIDCKPPSNLVEMIEKDLDFEKLEEFGGSFEQHELVDI
jgi:hypothetical protein